MSSGYDAIDRVAVPVVPTDRRVGALQELLSHFDPFVAGILVPSAIVLVLVPDIDRNPATEARNRKVAVLVFTGLLLAAVVLIVMGTFFRGPGWRFVAPWGHLYLEL